MHIKHQMGNSGQGTVEEGNCRGRKGKRKKNRKIDKAGQGWVIRRGGMGLWRLKKGNKGQTLDAQGLHRHIIWFYMYSHD